MITGQKQIQRGSHQGSAPLIGRREPCIRIRTDAELTVITIRDEITASDIDGLSPRARRLVRDCGVLVIDLSGSGFIAVDGLCALLTLWSSDPAASERFGVREVRICSEGLTIVVRRVG
jgi:hypothetical protein